MDLPEWVTANNAGGTAYKRPWFVVRGRGLDHDRTPFDQRYLFRADGNVRRFASRENAQRIADRLNREESS